MFNKKWKSYLKEIKSDANIQIYCDMDGVIVDFEGGAIEQINNDLTTPSQVPEDSTKLFHELQSKLEDLGRDQQI